MTIGKQNLWPSLREQLWELACKQCQFDSGSNSLTTTMWVSVLFTFRLQSQGHTFVKYILIGWPENWVKLMKIFNGTHFTVQSIRATS